MKHRRRPDANNLAGQASRAIGWSFFSTAFSKLGGLGIGILLARLLGPSQYGVVAVGTVALLAVLSFNELGVSLAIVRWPGDPKEIAPTVATISLVSSLLLFAGVYLSAPAFAKAMGAPDATSVVRVLSTLVVINGIVSTPAALMERYFSQARKTIADQVQGWLAAFVSLGLAWAGLGAMGLALGQFIGSVVGGILLVKLAPIPYRLGFDAHKARELMKFGLPLAGSSMVVFLIGNADNFIVGRMLGATALGFYVLAWNLASWPVNMFSQPVRSVAPAMFSRLQHDPAAMRRSFVSVATALSAVTLPICLLLSGSAVPLIRFVYGSKWAPAAHVLVWLAVLAALRILFELAYDYFVVLARSRVVLTVQIVWLLALIPSLVVGARMGGVRGVAISGVAVAAFVILPWYLIELSRVGVSLRALGSGLWLPVLAAGGVGVVVAEAAKAIRSDLVACVVGGFVALATIGVLVYYMRPTLTMLRATLNGQSVPVARSASESAIPNAVDPATQRAALQALLAISVPMRAMPLHDMTGPLPIYRERVPNLPLYLDTVASARWDPSSAVSSAQDSVPSSAVSKASMLREILEAPGVEPELPVGKGGAGRSSKPLAE